MKPKVNKTITSSGCSTNVVPFSIKETILRIVTNKSLFTLKNLLLSPKYPFSDPPESAHYGKVNSGSWFKETKQKEYHLTNHILMPLYQFINGLSVDKYRKLTVEAAFRCCLWINRKARNRASTWWVQGFVQYQNLLRN